MKKSSKSAIVTISLLLIIMLSGCATRVSFSSIQPAEVNMSQYRTLGVFEFSEYELSRFSKSGYILLEFIFNNQFRSSLEAWLLPQNVAQYVTSEVVRALDRTDYFRVIPPRQLRDFFVDQAIFGYDGTRVRQSLGIDALIIGAIEDMQIQEYVQPSYKLDGQNWIVTEYFVQEVYLEVSYSVVAVEDGRILATKRLDGSRSRSVKIPDPEDMPPGWSKDKDFKPPDLFPLFKSIIDSFIPEIRDQLAPRTVRQYRTLERDKMDDPRMEHADDMVKNNNYHGAVQEFLNVWYDTRNFAAGYNASILYEALGELDKAVSLMREVASMTGERKAFRELNRLVAARDDYYRAIEQVL